MISMFRSDAGALLSMPYLGSSGPGSATKPDTEPYSEHALRQTSCRYLCFAAIHQKVLPRSRVGELVMTSSSLWAA